MWRARACALVFTLGLVVAGCASGSEWQAWRAHPAHFASVRHLAFSMQTGEDGFTADGSDVIAAREEGWWGRVAATAAPAANVAGTWRGVWRGVGVFNTPRSANAEASFAQIGDRGTGRLRLHETLAADVPDIVTEQGPWGVRVAYTVSGSHVMVRDASGNGRLRLVLTLDGERLTGTITNAAAPVWVVLTRVSP